MRPFRRKVEGLENTAAALGSKPELAVVAAAGEVNPAYTRTRIANVDRRHLAGNKILSAVHSGTVANRVKLLRAQVLRRLQELGGNTLLVTSALAGEGKTLTATNLAVSISHEVNRTVCLVDADMRKPSVHSRFGLEASAGLSDYLAGRADVSDLLINPSGMPKLTLLPAGKPLANSSELLGSPRMASLVAEMKARYPQRVLIFDAPAVLAWDDALVFSGLVDAVLVVVEAERTSRRDVARTLALLGDRPVLGIVYNKWRDIR
jgi:non-specific protein-tyrosine kinase